MMRARSDAPISDTAATTSPSTTSSPTSDFTPIDALLPTAMPPGLRAARVSTTTFNTSERYTVWSTCQQCASPTGALALVRRGTQPGTVSTTDPHTDLVIQGRQARFYPATDTRLDTTLMSTDGADPGFSFLGWGLDQQTMVDLARSFIGGEDVPTHDGLDVVFDGQAGSPPGLVNMDATVSISYRNSIDDTGVDYLYGRSKDAVASLDFMLWLLPNATRTTLAGHAALTSVTGHNSTIVYEIDAHTLVEIGTNSPSLTVTDLANIQLTDATPKDHRWDLLRQGA
jgi:hypothetical protein